MKKFRRNEFNEPNEFNAATKITITTITIIKQKAQPAALKPMVFRDSTIFNQFLAIH